MGRVAGKNEQPGVPFERAEAIRLGAPPGAVTLTSATSTFWAESLSQISASTDVSSAPAGKKTGARNEHSPGSKQVTNPFVASMLGLKRGTKLYACMVWTTVALPYVRA